MLSKVVLLLCLAAVALAGNSYNVMMCGNTTTAKASLEETKCAAHKFGNATYTLKLENVAGVASNKTLTGTLGVFSDTKCTRAVGSSAIACGCGTGAQFRFVCEGAAFAIPSLLVVIAAVVVHLLWEARSRSKMQ